MTFKCLTVSGEPGESKGTPLSLDKQDVDTSPYKIIMVIRNFNHRQSTDLNVLIHTGNLVIRGNVVHHE